MKPDSELSPRQRKAIVALMTSRTADDAARVVGVTPRTLRRWLTDDRFVAELKAAELPQLKPPRAAWRIWRQRHRHVKRGHAGH